MDFFESKNQSSTLYKCAYVNLMLTNSPNYEKKYHLPHFLTNNVFLRFIRKEGYRRHCRRSW